MQDKKYILREQFYYETINIDRSTLKRVTYLHSKYSINAKLLNEIFKSKLKHEKPNPVFFR